jgi:hypothetical protein
MSGQKGEIYHHDTPHHHLFRDFTELYDLSSLFTQKSGPDTNGLLHDLPSIDVSFPNFADYFNTTADLDTLYRSVDAPYSSNIKKESLHGMDHVTDGVISNNSTVSMVDCGALPGTPNSSMSYSSSEGAAMDGKMDCMVLKQEEDEEVKGEVTTKVEEADKTKKV